MRSVDAPMNQPAEIIYILFQDMLEICKRSAKDILKTKQEYVIVYKKSKKCVRSISKTKIYQNQLNPFFICLMFIDRNVGIKQTC
jgi:hypothetical protein